MRILWSSNALWANTGYGVQARHLLPKLAEHGHEVAQFAWYGLRAAVIEAGGIRVYPAHDDPWGIDVVQGHLRHWKADLLISLHDIWVLPPDYADLIHETGAKWACWFPIDHDPCPQSVITQAIKADYAINYSKFGQDAARALGVDCPYIPHGIGDAFFDNELTKAEARAKLEVPEDTYLCSMVAANKSNPSRKGFPEILSAWAPFAKEHPEAMLYLHTQEQARDGIDFRPLFKDLEIDPSRVRFCDQYLQAIGSYTEEYLAALYTASDCLLAASRSEGFGIPIVEAQACGCPVITTDAQSMTELTWNGIATKPAQREWTPLEAWIAVPSIQAIYEAMQEIYNWSDEQRKQGAEGGRAQAEFYRWDRVVDDFWLPFLERVQADMDAAEGKIPETCRDKGHDWAKVGIWNQGLFSIPCKRPDCKAENKGGYTVLDGFPMEINGVPLDLTDPAGGVGAKLICKEVSTEYDLDKIPLEAGDLVLELGAHVGEIACYLGTVHEGLDLVLYEAAPENIEHLRANLERNGVRAEVFGLAVMASDDPPTVKLGLEHADHNSGGYSVMQGDGAQSFEAPTVGFDTVMTSAIWRRPTKAFERAVKFLIMDIEGAEWDILDIMSSFLEHVEYLRLEIHNDGPGSLERAQALAERIAEYVDPEKMQIVNQGMLRHG